MRVAYLGPSGTFSEDALRQSGFAGDAFTPVLCDTVSDVVSAVSRGEADRALASIEGAVGLDRPAMERLEAMPKDTALAFLCHHGESSMGAAEYFRKQGFTNISNVAGGINAWSMEIDPSVPRY